MSKISKKTYRKYARDYFENEEHEEDAEKASDPEEEADWSSFDKLKPWQIDLLEAYSTPGSSSEDPMEEILSAKKLSGLKKRVKKRNNLEEDKKEKEVKMRNAFINLKLARTFLVPEVTKKPKRMIHGLLSILKESSESESVPEEQSSESDSSGDSIESIETPPLDEGSDSDDSAHRRTFVSGREKKEIDELFSHNFFDLTSKSRRQRECRIPKMCFIEDDKPPINVSLSYKTLTEENLKEKGRDYFLHRITYVFTFDEPDEQEGFATMFNSYINDQNEYYDDKYKLTGLAIFYKEGYGLVMVEGSELEVMVHFHGFKGSDVFKLMDNSKILYIHGHVIRRYMDNFVFCTVNSPISDEEDKSSSEIIQSIHIKIKKCCQALSRKSTSSEDFYELPKSYVKFVPPVSEIAFCTDYEPLRDLKEYVDETEKIPDVSDSSDEGWPPTDESIPFNVFNEARRKRVEKAIVPAKGATSQWTYSKKFYKSKKKDKKEKPVGSLKKRIIKSLMKNVKIKEEGKILV